MNNSAAGASVRCDEIAHYFAPYQERCDCGKHTRSEPFPLPEKPAQHRERCGGLCVRTAGHLGGCHAPVEVRDEFDADRFWQDDREENRDVAALRLTSSGLLPNDSQKASER